MKRWPKIAIIIFILLFVMSIMTSKTEVVQFDHGSGVGVEILHKKKLFFIHSFQLAVDNSTDQTIYVQEPVSAFTLIPGGTFPTKSNDAQTLKALEAGQTLAGNQETIWRLAKRFQLTANVQFEMNGQLQTIHISEQLGD